jgi:FkbM family methyltransferase
VRGHCPNRTQHLLPCKMHDRTRAGPACTRSEGEEGFVIDYFFGGLQGTPQRGGVFLELGAHDGRTMANTLHLEGCLGWRGLLVEGQPANFQLLAKHRPRALALRMAVCRSHGKVNFTTTTDVIAGIYQHIAKSHRRQFKMKERDVIPVDCGPLGDWLGLLQFSRVDLMLLDVEGSEKLVLETIDWSRFSVRVFLVECAGSGAYGCLNPRDQGTMHFLKARGLSLITAFRARHDIWDMVFLNRSWTSPWDPPRGWEHMISLGPA